MRIRKLGLRRYGKFTDAFIDFGEQAAGKPDMHIVYGPNEAGKSTAMSACTDMIYGIPPQSRFNFLHPYATMRIEAEIEISGRVRGFSRIKRPNNSNAVPDTLLVGELGGLDRNAYQTMFCLDDETLEVGGESILASKGDLGHLLFSATAGLADLSGRLGSAQEEAEAFFRPGRRSGILAELKKTLAALKEERERIDTLATEYARLVIERDEEPRPMRRLSLNGAGRRRESTKHNASSTPCRASRLFAPSARSFFLSRRCPKRPHRGGRISPL